MKKPKSWEFAKYGRALSPIQRLVQTHLSLKRKGSPCGETLSKKLLGAVERRDAKLLRQVIDILEWKPNPKKSYDEEAVFLAGMAELCKTNGIKVPLSRLRKALGREATDDGDSSLRRKAKLYGVPIAAAKRGRKNSRH